MNNAPKIIVDLAEAIAKAEGFGILGAVPTRAHNPGDLKLSGYPVTGLEGISVFANDEIGWQKLYDQLDRIARGNSHVYNLQMTFEDFARKWTDTQQSNWLNNVLLGLVASGYQVTKDSTLEDYFFTRQETE